MRFGGITGGEVEMLKITNSVTPITGNTLVILSLPANLMIKIIKKRSVLICLSPFLSTGGDDIAKTRHQINLSNSTSFSKDGYSSNNTGITGIAGEHDQLNYGIYVNQQQQNNDTSLGTNLSWRTPIAIIDGSYSHSKNAWQSGGSISSGLVVWPGGINITNQLSDTFAILDAPG